MPKSAVAMFTLTFIAIVWYDLLWALIGLILVLLPWLDHPLRRKRDGPLNAHGAGDVKGPDAPP